ncbi:hypothetical protein [Salipiger sp. PrR003]|uniref:3'-5' exonuclease n=1 Tax=Salipiger sp. PrR003 TaxID=2706776 RepID=UPI0013DC7B20|nr:hypothetical protein [Salipiger sp. PrR003]NDV50183.1 hypothetical protein [Salipiger sp. PrR003]
MRPSKAEIRRLKLEKLLPNLRFVDIEACNGGPDAWPVEIGWSRIQMPEEPEGQIGFDTTSSMIRPASQWDESKWSRHAQDVHGIARSTLVNAPRAYEVAAQVLEALNRPELVIVSDSPRNDQPWMDTLLETVCAKGWIQITSPWQALNGLATPEEIAATKAWLRENKGPHRAGEDAERLARGVMESIVRPASIEPTPGPTFP